MWTKWRYRWSFRFGRAEHVSARLLGGVLCGVALLLILKPEIAREFKIFSCLWFLCTLLWIAYWLCHSLEKRFRPKKRKKS